MLNRQTIQKFKNSVDSLVRIRRMHSVPESLHCIVFSLGNLARWQSGYAADCKSVDLGSTPGGASILNNFRWCLLFLNGITKTFVCPGGGIGRHKGFKIPRRSRCAGSSPARGTISLALP